MYFHAGYKETVLFHWWTIETVVGYLFTCLIIFLAAFLLEFLISLRHRFEIQKKKKKQRARRRQQQQQRQSREGETFTSSPPPTTTAVERVLGAVDSTCLHMLSLTLAYPIMLVIMTFNYGFAFSVVLGAGLGYFLFSGMRSFSEEGDSGAEGEGRESGCH